MSAGKVTISVISFLLLHLEYHSINSEENNSQEIIRAYGTNHIPEDKEHVRLTGFQKWQSLRQFESSLLKKEVGVMPTRERNRMRCILTLKDELRRVVEPYVRGKQAILLDQVFHWNIGDSFIQFGEHLFLKEMGTPNKIPCTAVDYFGKCNKTRLKEAINRDSRPPILLIRGGGNFGDLYIDHRRFINEYVESFTDVPMLLLPQSVFYTNASAAQEDAAVRGKHKRFDMLARDLVSLDKMRRLFPQHKSFLCPDFAQFIGPVDKSQCKPSVDVLFLARVPSDMERVNRFGNLSEAAEYLDLLGITHKTMDWYDFEGIVDKHNMTYPRWDPVVYPKFRTEIGIKMLCEGQLIVTDRLHATVMSMLMGLPHIYLDNSYGKIASYKAACYQPIPWCADDNLRARQARSWKEAVQIVVQMFRDDPNV